jgi:hypothetical protein
MAVRQVELAATFDRGCTSWRSANAIAFMWFVGAAHNGGVATGREATLAYTDRSSKSIRNHPTTNNPAVLSARAVVWCKQRQLGLGRGFPIDHLDHHSRSNILAVGLRDCGVPTTRFRLRRGEHRNTNFAPTAAHRLPGSRCSVQGSWRATRSTGDLRLALRSAGAVDGSWSGAGISWTRTPRFCRQTVAKLGAG